VKYYTNKARQAGMTLIELTVVLLVLIGLAGLLMPYVGGFVTKTHDSTGASNLSAVNRAIMQYEAAQQSFPDRMDSLIDTDLVVYKKLMDAKCLQPTLLTQKQTNAIMMAGINTAMVMDKATADATFEATTGGTAGFMMGMTTQPTVATLKSLSDCGSATAPELISNDNLKGVITRAADINMFDYVVFGIGSDSSLIGKTMATAPVHFAQQGTMGPKARYNRFGAVFEVPKGTVLANGGYCVGFDTAMSGTADASQPTDEIACLDDGDLGAGAGAVDTVGSWTDAAQARAKFAGAIMLMTRIEGQQAALQNHYDKANEG